LMAEQCKIAFGAGHQLNEISHTCA
jgi:hypothetical protein